MRDYWNDPPEPPEPPLCKNGCFDNEGLEMKLDPDGRWYCPVCGEMEAARDETEDSGEASVAEDPLDGELGDLCCHGNLDGRCSKCEFYSIYNDDGEGGGV